MENIKYYDVVTKQEIGKGQIKANVPYITLNGKWKIRLVTFQENGHYEEKFLSLQEEQEAKREILRVNLKERGYIVENIQQAEEFWVDDIKFNVPNYAAQVKNKQGMTDNLFFNNGTLEELVQESADGKHIKLNNYTINGGKSLLEGNSIGESSVGNAKDKPHIILNIDQWGFKGTYDLSKEEDYARLLKDQEIMPKSKEEAMQKHNIQREE